MVTRRKLIAANWKMNVMISEGIELAESIDEYSRSQDSPDCDLLICPTALILSNLAKALINSAIAIGAQNCHAAVSGAYTGEISASMLINSGASYVILGHSERRHVLNETDNMVRLKAMAAQKAGLNAIVCIGETENERENNQTITVLTKQLEASLPTDITLINGTNTVVAYEPVWAIGSGKTPTNDEIASVHNHIRDCLEERIGEQAKRIRLLYGGLMKPDNAASILAINNVDGGLIGGASLNSKDFCDIVSAIDYK